MKNPFPSKKKVVYHDPVLGLESSTPPSSPYLDAKREWMERYGSDIKQKRVWQVVALAALGIAAIAVAGNVYQAGQTKVRTYIVETSKFGDPVKVTSADAAEATDPRYVARQLEMLISLSRRVTTDPKVQKQWLDDVYAMAGPACAETLNAYYRKPENDPWNRMKTETVTVNMAPATELNGAKTWQIEWEETRYSLTGQQIGAPGRYQAIISAGHVDQQDPQKYMKNISGTVCESLAWNPRL